MDPTYFYATFCLSLWFTINFRSPPIERRQIPDGFLEWHPVTEGYQEPRAATSPGRGGVLSGAEWRCTTDGCQESGAATSPGWCYQEPPN